MYTWMRKNFHMIEHSAVLNRLNRICLLIGLEPDREPIGQPMLSHEEFTAKVDRLIRRVEGKGCLKQPQS